MVRHDRRQVRKERILHIKKKENILKTFYTKADYEKYHRTLTTGKLSKGKVHCGCPLCKPYKYHYYESAQNQKKLDKCKDMMNDFYSEAG